MSDTKLTYELDGSGRIMVKATNQGVLLTKEEAERVVAHIDELERSYAILQNHFDKTRQRWIMRGEHIAKQRERIEELESLVKDMARDCMGCKFECYSENSSGGGYCGIFERVRNLTDGDAE